MICELTGFTARGVSFCAVVSLLTLTMSARGLPDVVKRGLSWVMTCESVIRSLEQAPAVLAMSSARVTPNDLRCIGRLSGWVRASDLPSGEDVGKEGHRDRPPNGSAVAQERCSLTIAPFSRFDGRGHALARKSSSRPSGRLGRSV